MLRIKRIVITGFKTFAQRTDIVFDPGITAIVGPNGCGKSNIADAVRWCLGEQSFALLRSKRTFDVIFSGSDRRARLNMATVSLVLDNSEGELNIDFSEVEITRRAYRDGDNEYLINGQQVRLQDITQLLAPSGLGKRTYAVVGQGLIDRVLSLKPEERRTLFEEAAGITGFQLKRAASFRRLEATNQNLDRVRDILAELEPQLRNLKRQSDRALERQRIELALKELLHIWYGHQWRRTLSELEQAQVTAEKDRASNSVRQNRLASTQQKIVALRDRQASLRSHLNEQRQLVNARLQQVEAVSRRAAVTGERQRQTVARQEELQLECDELQEAREAVQARFTTLRREVEQAQAKRQASQDAVDLLREKIATQQQEDKARTDRWRQAETALKKAERLVTDRSSRLEQITERRETLKGNLAELEEELQDSARFAEKAATDHANAESDLSARRKLLTEIQIRIEGQTESVAEMEFAHKGREEARQQAERNVVKIETRLDLLQRMREEGAGYASGVRAVLQAAQKGELEGVVGTVASKLELPARLERAVEVALGAALQNVIVRTWGEAQRAIEKLKRTGAGRATFLPLDRLRSGSSIPAPHLAGIQGNAAELVQCESDAAPAVRHLLQRIWIADDLASARSALDAHQGKGRDAGAHSRPARRPPGAPPTVVTLDGEIIRPGGAVTGGNDGRHQHSSVLGREREARELPAALEVGRRELRLATDNARTVGEKISEFRESQMASEEERKIRSVDVERTLAKVEQARTAEAQARQKFEWQLKSVDQVQKERKELDSQEALLQQMLDGAKSLRLDAQERASSTEKAAQKGSDELLSQLADLRADAAVAEGNLRSRRALTVEQRRSLDLLSSQFQSKSQRLKNLLLEGERLATTVGQVSADERTIREGIAGLQGQIVPLEKKLGQIEREQVRVEAEERSMQALLQQSEAAWHVSQLALRRTEDRLDELRRDIRQDFDLEESESAADLAHQPPLTLHALLERLPVVEQLPPTLKDEIRETRTRLRRLSNVNPEAPQEYRQAEQRHSFLQTQVDDLEGAAQDLLQLVRVLDRQMEGSLRRTYDAVSTEFVRFFKMLFQGGTSHLIISDAEDILNTGIEVIARPPGKRPLSLDLLSGGERSLTACALVLAILQVSPTPFCVLDEVDATLDEANVDRLRIALDSLSSLTQFIVISHNRRTLVGARNIYGITMGDDGVSRVISLRLEGREVTDRSEEQTAKPAVVAL